MGTPADKKEPPPGWMDKFSPIEEEPGPSMSPRHGASIVSPVLSESQTVSSASTKTVRGNTIPVSPAASQVTTPSYPFPTIPMDSGTPLSTPALHKPFMALSPTVAPFSSTFKARGQTSRDSMAAGHLMPSSMRASVPSAQEGLEDLIQTPGPNLYKVMLRIQSEPGLPPLWSQLTQTLKEYYGAERAILAVPSDSTDVENIPWVQMATYNVGEELSPNQTMDSQGGESVAETSGQVGTTGDDTSERHSSPTNTNTMSLSGFSAFPARPRLESRHSYAGYPPNFKASNSDPTIAPHPFMRRPTASRAGSHMSLYGGRPADESAGRRLELSAELLQRHNANESSMGAPSEITQTSSRQQAGTILSSFQPLEAESEPLITSAGVVRVLDRNRVVVLTRDYTEQSVTPEQPSNQEASKGPIKFVKWPTPYNPLLGSGDKPQMVNIKPVRIPNRPRSQTSGSSHSSSALHGVEEENSRLPYNDYEQINTSAWSQSPGASPAPQVDAEVNPFFSQRILDERLFAEDPAPDIVTDDNDMPTIGVDRAAAVIHVPLIHPTLSQSKRPQRLVDNHKSKLNSARFKQASVTLSSESGKKMPIAILSIMSSVTPYPPSLVESLERLAPLLATAFYNARQHSNLENEVHGLGRRRKMEVKSGLRDNQPTVSTTGPAVSTYTESKERAFSPVSTSSVNSEYSSMSMRSPRGSIGGGSVAATPGWVGLDTGSKSGKQTVHSPGILGTSGVGNTDSYFSLNFPTYPHSAENYFPSTTRDTEQEAATTDRRPRVTNAATSTAIPGYSESVAGMTQSAMLGQSTADTEYCFKEPSMSMLKMMVENGATQQFVAEPEFGKIVWTNSKYQAYRNTSALEIHKHSWRNIHDEEKSAFKKLWRKALVSGDQVSLRVRLMRFDGVYRWFHMKILPQRDRHGLIKHWHGQAMDTHDQHMAEIRAAREKEKAASEAKYRALANSNPHSIFAASITTGITFANTQWLSYSGQSLEDTLGFGFLDHVHPDDLVRCRFPGVGEPLDLDQVKSSLKPQIPLIRQESTASSTAESHSDSDRTMRQEPVSPGGTLSEIEAPSDLLRALVKDGIVKCTKDGQGNITVTTEMRLKSRTGEYRWHLVQGSLIESVNFGQGEAQWFLACADITDQKYIEAQLKQANDALEKEMSRKMEYLSSMSHEIRTPLNGILGNLQFLTNSGLDEHQQDWVFGAQKAAQGMHKLINDILDVSKAEAKMLKLSRQWFNVRSIIEEVTETLMSKATEKGLELCYELQDTVPSQINGDSGRIKQVLLNLVGNAIKFTKDGEVSVKCEIPTTGPSTKTTELAPNEMLLQFSVQDTGSGFTDNDAKLLFKPYSQIDNNDTRNIGGTGLGLILCRTMVELHGGEIWAESVPGKGSTFTFYARFYVRGGEGSSSSADTQSSIVSPYPIDNDRILRDSTTESPGPIVPSLKSDQISPTVQSTPSTTQSEQSNPFSIHRSSTSTTTSERQKDAPLIKLRLPFELSEDNKGTNVLLPSSVETVEDPEKTPLANALTPTVDAGSFRPPLLSVLIVCPQENTRRTTQEHIQRILPKSVPSQVTTEGDVKISLNMIAGDNPVIFTHIVLQLGSATEVLTLMDQILDSNHHANTCIVVITDQAQKSAICSGAPKLDYDQLSADSRLLFVMKPTKPSKFAKIFNPDGEQAQGTDDQTRNELREKQLSQRHAYATFKRVFGNKGLRALAVEDNSVNMAMLDNFLGRICLMDVTKAWDGEECLDAILSHGPGYFSVVVCDIEMPRMDGYTACRKIREWEEKHGYPHVAMISLSANVMSKGWRESAEAGFTHYAMKPVEWADLGNIMIDILKPDEPHVFLRDRPLPEELLKNSSEEPSPERAEKVPG